ncbi:unnamed protein product [Bemisia tabaci]|uniref:Fukutin n=1 Tax=Bemisia tabaci TaxID=7038 RepID=A0A9P0F340_BEMTA|nr:PREDICTED: uncharacterized protein LOC109040294 [Bemisia tabaci]CAH0386900.1 unnamed protein product [Bemisia tabaci]
MLASFLGCSLKSMRRVPLIRKLYFIGASIILLTWLFVRYTQETFTETCHHTEAFQDNLHSLASRVHNVLAALKLTHFLCYGSLWGQIRLSRSLPWESNVEFCVFNEELITKDEVYLQRVFKQHQLLLSYDSSEGLYSIMDPKIGGALVELVVFEENPQIGMMRRIGWKRRLLPPDCEAMSALDCFPTYLVSSPLPSREFGGYDLPVPREGIEIQKYHFPQNWWKEVLPKNC